jgi:hypothetical protein
LKFQEALILLGKNKINRGDGRETLLGSQAPWIAEPPFKSSTSRGDDMQKISPFLWFDTQAEEAMHHYVAIFMNSKIGKIARYDDAGPGPKGSVMTAAFEIEGQQFTALNGGPNCSRTSTACPGRLCRPP